MGSFRGRSNITNIIQAWNIKLWKFSNNPIVFLKITTKKKKKRSLPSSGLHGYYMKTVFLVSISQLTYRKWTKIISNYKFSLASNCFFFQFAYFIFNTITNLDQYFKMQQWNVTLNKSINVNKVTGVWYKYRR